MTDEEKQTYSKIFGVVQYNYDRLADEVIMLCGVLKESGDAPDAQEQLVRSIAKLSLASIELESGK